MNEICDSRSMRLVITGGHHSSAMPVIKHIREKHPNVEIFWIGHRRSMKGDLNDTLEYREITGLGIPFYELNAGKVYRTYDLIRLLKVPFGFFQSISLLSKIKPAVILSFGGYLAVPVVMAGWVMGIPSVTHEQTSVTGYANKLISYFAKKILVSWPQSQHLFPKDKVIVTGIPLRPEIQNPVSNNFSTDNELPTILIIAGKTGSHFINNSILNSMNELLKFCNVIHQCGDNSVFNDFEKLEGSYKKLGDGMPGKYFLRKFIFADEIGEAYSRTSIVVSRSGAHTTAELLALEKPCILIPISWSSHNEQGENSKFLKKAGLAEVLDEKICTAEELLSLVKNMLHNLSKYSLNNRDLKNFLKVNSAELITNETLATSKKN